jgi:hypothetical protein
MTPAIMFVLGVTAGLLASPAVEPLLWRCVG